MTNGLETDIDCGGGVCDPCADGGNCNIGDDCSSGNCAGGTCVAAPTCQDTTRNGGETDVDCGGPDCDPCGLGLGCTSDSDCLSANCDGGICSEPPAGLVSASFVVSNDWGSGYCAYLHVANQTAGTITSWAVTYDLKGATAFTQWNGNFSGTSGQVTVTPLSWNAVIGAGQTNASVGFCANRNGSTGIAEVISASGS
jgi:cellulase/cellobiase CelA1